VKRARRTNERIARRRRGGGAAGAALLAALTAACTPSVAKLTNPTSPRCQDTLRSAFESILLDQKESPQSAADVAQGAAWALADVDLGAKPFRVQSPTSGIDYAFVFERDDTRCLMHLVAMQAGSLQLSNNVTYLETRLLKGCGCVQ
jgi:hypothetical protein